VSRLRPSHGAAIHDHIPLHEPKVSDGYLHTVTVRGENVMSEEETPKTVIIGEDFFKRLMASTIDNDKRCQRLRSKVHHLQQRNRYLKYAVYELLQETERDGVWMEEKEPVEPLEVVYDREWDKAAFTLRVVRKEEPE